MFTMKKIIPLVLLCVFLVSGCKEKGSAVKSGKKEFSVTGCKVDLDSYFVVDLYKTKDCAEKIMELDKNMHLTIAEVSEFGEELRVVNSDKSINGWVHTSAVLLDKEVLFRCLKSLLKGNKAAACLIENVSRKEITVEESLENLKLIIDFLGPEKFKKLNPENKEDKPVFIALDKLLNNFERKDHCTNQIHLLADYAGEELLKWSRNALWENYAYCCVDSEGLTCNMRAIKNGNLDAVRYYYFNKVPDTYFINQSKTYDEQDVLQKILNKADDNGKSLIWYIHNCSDESLKKFLEIYEIDAEKLAESYVGILTKKFQNSESLNEALINCEREFEWLNQEDFEKKRYYTVVKNAKVIGNENNSFMVKPFDKVEILAAVPAGDNDYLYDYGDQSADFPKKYYNRYNYYLIRTEDCKIGVVGGSAIAHAKMDYTSSAQSFSLTNDFDLYYSLFYETSPELYENGKYYYADLYKTYGSELKRLETGVSHGIAFIPEPLYAGLAYEPPVLKFLDYVNFEAEVTVDYENDIKGKGDFCSIVITRPIANDEWYNLEYLYYTIYENNGFAFKGLSMEERESSYKDDWNLYTSHSYTGFKYEKGDLPEIIYGHFGDVTDMEGRSHSHKVRYFKLDIESYEFEQTNEEDLPYLPEW